MRLRPALACGTFALLASLAGCGGGGDETHGVKGDGKGGSGKGGTGTIPTTGGSGTTIPTNGGTTSSGGAGNSPGQGGSDNCATTTASATPEAPVLVFLVDTSQSMNEDAPGGNGTKWDVTQGALADAFMSMRDGINVGLIFYPDVPTGSMPCFDSMIDVNIAPLDMGQRGLLDGALNMAGPSGSTPTHDAYVYALEQLRASTLPGQKYVVLITDGVPTYALMCVGSGQPSDPAPTGPLIDESATAMSGGIRTFVIGSPGSEDARNSLSQMASRGGTALAGCTDDGPNFCHLDMTQETNFSTALNDALDQVIAGIPLSCEFALPSPPPGQELDPGKVNVTYVSGSDSQDLGRDTSGDCMADGWDYTADGSHIRLCGALCDQVKEDPTASISIVLGCTTRPVTEPP
jgi:hypothetical protein